MKERYNHFYTSIEKIISGSIILNISYISFRLLSRWQMASVLASISQAWYSEFKFKTTDT